MSELNLRSTPRTQGTELAKCSVARFLYLYQEIVTILLRNQGPGSVTISLRARDTFARQAAHITVDCDLLLRLQLIVYA